MRLSWVQTNAGDATDGNHDLSQSAARGSRRFARNPFLCPVPLASPELEATLASIDDWYPGKSSELQHGAFSVFPSKAITDSEPGPVAQENPSHVQSVATDDPTPTGQYNPSPTLDRQSVHSVCGGTGDPTEEGFSGPDGLPTCATHMDHESVQPRQQVPSRHLDALSMPAKQRRLIHHWITFTSRKIVLIDEPHNPCRTMMLPMALKGLVSHIDASNADVAIFHAICAAAAYNLYELTGRGNDEDHVLAIYHDDAAVHHLRHNLSRADGLQDQSFAMAIMACIAVEAVSGTTQRWRTHVSGGLAYLTKLQDQGVDEATLSPFRQHMVKMAILCGFSVPSHLKEFLIDESGASDDLEFTFPYYGVSRRFLRANDYINSLLAQSPGTRMAAESELDSFELQMYLDFPSLSQHAMRNNTKNATVIQHTSRAFYYAGLVFYQQSVRQGPIEAAQELVELGIQELESLELIGSTSLGCLMLWPALVLGAECNTSSVQGRMRKWFQAQRRLGFRNVVILEDLVTMLWAARNNPASTPEESDWRHVIAQPRYDVFRL